MKIEKNFIVFEGIDGSGKGTQIALLKEYFEKKGTNNVVFTFEHTRTGEWSEKIEEIIHKRVPFPSMKDMQLLFILDRKLHIENIIRPALKKKKTVFCDRYILSTLAYGSMDPSLHWKTLLQYHRDILGDDFPFPEHTIFIDVDPDVAMSRIHNNRDSATVFEAREKFERIRKNYLSIGTHFDGFTVIDGLGSPEEVFEEVRVVLKDYL